MNGATKRGRLLRFSVFEVDLDSGELFKQGRKVKLQGQPFDLLLALTERPGAVITREELKQKVWPSDTVVDFDHGLNRAINKVRQALGDSADSPRFVETVPRRGYRFIGSIQTESSAQPPPGPASPQTTPELLQPGSKTRSRKKVWFIAGVLACVALAVGVAITIASYVIAWRTPPPIVSLPLTSYPGFEKHPSFSPDGRQVTFSWNGEKQDNYDIYVLLTSGGAPLRLTTHPAPDTLLRSGHRKGGTSRLSVIQDRMAQSILFLLWVAEIGRSRIQKAIQFAGVQTVVRSVCRTRPQAYHLYHSRAASGAN